jgi:hypothetical protein
VLEAEAANATTARITVVVRVEVANSIGGFIYTNKKRTEIIYENAKLDYNKLTILKTKE